MANRDLIWKCSIKIVLLSISGVLLLSCQHGFSEISRINFIGDSHVAFWDVQFDFPDRIIYNYGKKGAGIDYLSSFEGKFRNETVVVIIGTNDIEKLLSSGEEKEYVDKYINTVLDLDAKQTILISIFPLTGAEINEVIVKVNSFISSEASNKGFIFVDVYEHFYLKDAFNPLYTDDGRHPNREGYSLLSREVRKAL